MVHIIKSDYLKEIGPENSGLCNVIKIRSICKENFLPNGKVGKVSYLLKKGLNQKNLICQIYSVKFNNFSEGFFLQNSAERERAECFGFVTTHSVRMEERFRVC